jgi:hypothetical protein
VILPSVDGVIAVEEEAKRLREEFEQAAGFVNGLPVGATVSIGVASDSEVGSGLSRVSFAAQSRRSTPPRARAGTVWCIWAPMAALSLPSRPARSAPLPRGLRPIGPHRCGTNEQRQCDRRAGHVTRAFC